MLTRNADVDRQASVQSSIVRFTELLMMVELIKQML